MGFDKHLIELEGDRVWLLDASGKRLCDMTDMQLLDLGSRISVESGLLNFDLEAQKWRECLIALALSWIENHFTGSINQRLLFDAGRPIIKPLI